VRIELIGTMRKSIACLKTIWSRLMKAKTPDRVSILFCGVWRIREEGVSPLVRVSVTPAGINAGKAYGHIALQEECVQGPIDRSGGVDGN
jgi:hypothetical protein